MSHPPVLVLGMHRSGTSMATAILASAGLDVGTRLLGAHASNPRGHFEDEDFVDFNRAVLARLGMNTDGWVVEPPPSIPEELVSRARALIDRKREAGRPWGWKDPRTVPLLPLWRATTPDAMFAVVYRSPWEVIDSLLRRGDEVLARAPELAVLTWRHYNRMLLALATEASASCVLASVEAIAADPRRWAAMVSRQLGVPLGTPQEAIVDADLLHADRARERAGVLARHYPDVIDVYVRLEQHAQLPSGTDPFETMQPAVDPETERRLTMQDWAAAARAGEQSPRRRSVAADASAERVPGWCACCRADATFIATGPWLRDQFLCESCRSIPRFRAINVTLDTAFPGWEQSAILELAPPAPSIARLCARYTSAGPATSLTFADDTFDLVIAHDMLEHQFDPGAVLREILRVVKPGGAHVFTTPKHRHVRATRCRARVIDDRVEHVLPAEYHGDPLSDDRELVTWDFGIDFEARASEWAGLPVVSYVVRDRHLGLDGEYLDVFVCRKPEDSRG